MTGAPTGSAGGEVAGALAARDLMTQAFRSRDLNELFPDWKQALGR